MGGWRPWATEGDPQQGQALWQPRSRPIIRLCLSLLPKIGTEVSGAAIPVLCHKARFIFFFSPPLPPHGWCESLLLSVPDPPCLLPPARVPPPMKRSAAASSPPLLSQKKPVAAVESPPAPQVPNLSIQSQPEAVALPALRVRRWERVPHSGMDLCRGLPVYFGMGGLFGILVLWAAQLRE